MRRRGTGNKGEEKEERAGGLKEGGKHFALHS